MKSTIDRFVRLTDEDWDRLWSKVEKTESCWIWKGKSGSIFLHHKPILVHRVIWEFYNKQKLSFGQHLFRRCNNPKCVNPDHLFTSDNKGLCERYFWQKVDKTDSCWVWVGGGDVYGGFQVGSKMVGAHRVSWELHNGQIPKGLLVLHICDNPRCVNPEHLFLGTQKENMIDKVKKGRQLSGENSPMFGKGYKIAGKKNGMFGRKGENCPNSKLTNNDIIRIRLLKKEGLKVLDVADMFNVGKTTIYRVLNKD